MNRGLILFVVAVVSVGWMMGYLNVPGEWYAGLAKPWFNPPNWVFGPVWTVLYILIATAGWRTWQRERMARPFVLWLLQMSLNFLWSPVFFSWQRMDVALLVLVALLTPIIMFIYERWRRDRISSLLFMPYAGWVAFAGMLNLSLLILN